MIAYGEESGAQGGNSPIPTIPGAEDNGLKNLEYRPWPMAIRCHGRYASLARNQELGPESKWIGSNRGLATVLICSSPLKWHYLDLVGCGGSLPALLAPRFCPHRLDNQLARNRIIVRGRRQGASALPSSSNVNFLRNIQGIVHLNAQIPDGAFNFRMSKEQLNRSKVPGSPIDKGNLGSP